MSIRQKGPIGDAVFVRLGSRPIPRVTRMMEVAKKLGYGAVFLGARREMGLPDDEIYRGQEIKRIGPFFPLLNGRNPALYLSSLVRFNISLIGKLKEMRPVVLHCSDIETMPAGVIYKWIFGAHVIFNIHDNLAQRYNVWGWLRVVLNLIEGSAVLFSDVAIVPEQFRRDALPRWCRRHVTVVRNTPKDRGMAPPYELTGRIRIFFGGWLDEGRGLRQLMELVRTNEDLELTVAGEGSCELVMELSSLERVRYLGFITHEEIMAETARAHVVAALYDPGRLINRYAASNKLAEALACGRPVLVNSEMLIARELEGFGCLFEVNYRNVVSNGALLLRTIKENNGIAYVEKCKSARSAYENLYSWADAEAAMERAFRLKQ
ncbi:glycosyltransferase [Wenzhouxiangella sp. XN24]|uniref:glycosyltransferase n=1 Tax=Wenzhouxiangella sp. XN24 TaxID=2713569 RepID=UPI0013EDDBF9|nr:glycosyltransferase [Wenzhouxiangella sp. XN24]NGX17022.1 glycosyltransferase family 4 protein [Wenzhouxiangella sp. XN24]